MIDASDFITNFEKYIIALTYFLILPLAFGFW